MAVSSRLCRQVALLLAALAVSLFPFAPHVMAEDSADFPIANGHFYSEANGQGGGSGQSGFAVTDDSGIPFWSTFSRDGGVAAFGYPISTRFLISSATDQALQKGILQWDNGVVSVINVLDVLHNAGLDAILQSRYFTPPPADTSPDAGLAWPQIVARHQQFLAGDPAIRAAYFAVADPITLYGLPMSQPTPEANGSVVVVRLQRAVLQQWLTNQPWAAAGQVTIANAGDIAKTAGLLPASSLTPQAPPTPNTSVPYSVSATTSENWSGYVAATDPNGGEPGVVSDVKATWTVPAVNCASTPSAAVGVWVGIDGVFSPTVEQTGTASNCVGGQPSYYAWLEIYPSAARTSGRRSTSCEGTPSGKSAGNVNWSSSNCTGLSSTGRCPVSTASESRVCSNCRFNGGSVASSCASAASCANTSPSAMAPSSSSRRSTDSASRSSSITRCVADICARRPASSTAAVTTFAVRVRYVASSWKRLASACAASDST